MYRATLLSKRMIVGGLTEWDAKQIAGGRFAWTGIGPFIHSVCILLEFVNSIFSPHCYDI
jgi:hypothetical protein